MNTPSDDPSPLARRLQALSPARRAVVERLLRERQDEGGAASHTARADLATVSFGQQRLWFMAQLDPASSVYNTVSSLSLPSPVDVAALQGAIDALVARHESLRTTFEAVDGQPFQRVNVHAAVVVELGVPTTEFVRRPFDLEHGPMVRVCVAADTGQVVACVHHIVTDGWSMGIFLQELSALYKARVRGIHAKLPPLPIRYRDYAAWQRAELSGSRLSELLDFWRAELAGLPSLDLVTDRPRPVVQSFRGGTIPVQIPPNVVVRLRVLSREQGATLFMAMLAGFSVLLGRYSGQDEIVIGSPVAGRTRSETEGVIGFFINTIVLRCDLRGDPCFRELLTRTRDRAMRAYAHQDLPFEKLVEDLQPERDISRNPLHQVVLHLVDLSSEKVRGNNTEHPHVSTGTSAFDLIVHLSGAGAELKGDIEYSSELFDRSSVKRLAEHLAVLLEALVSDPDAPLSRVQMLTPCERRQLEKLDATPAPVPSVGVVELIDAQAARTPDALAIDTLTYRGLVHAANGVAHNLLAHGAGPETLVAVSLARGADLAIALLGIWKAGAAYLPLDPNDPPVRRRQIITDARPLLVLDNPHQFGPSRADSPAVPTDPKRLAYAIYTSGSTGTPRGVLVEHGSLSNLIAWHIRKYQVTARDRATLIASPAFDASVWELWPYLTVGASLRVLPPATQSPSDILAWVAAERITMTFLVTPLAEAVLTEPMPPGLALRFLLTGGDRLHRSPEPGLPFNLLNHYGPTEATVVATACVVQPGTSESRPPIGRPIDNVQALVVDRHGQPLPVGVPGELWIGGAGLARGYLRQPELTTERFVKYRGLRMFRTGDRVRRHPDGTLDFLGRLDQQVKIRGFRIELGEIESALASYEGVREAVVVAREEEGGEKRLVAYYTVEGSGERPRVEQLRAHVSARLPEYMVPAAYVGMERMPLTANGKLDRKGLPLPEGEAYARQEYEAPRGETEEQLAKIWAEVLKVERVSRHDNFFKLGGHSLLAVTVVERMRRSGMQVDVRAMFATPTLAELAETASGETNAVEVPANGIPSECEEITGEMLPLVSLSQEEIDRIVSGVPGGARNIQDIYPLAPLQEGILFHHLMGGEGDPYLLGNLFSFESRGKVDEYLGALQGVIERHDILRTGVVW
ncbi:MAG TPA: amino acid adenylation domain-containing protein, partial [Candidatus Acidoferrum sp.]|nr:amino acid adenylation domain-containing protein [Candidatus Acidoferrum sp.]